jgi:hypothetical protein
MKISPENADENLGDITPSAFAQEELEAVREMHPEMSEEEVLEFIQEKEKGDDSISDLYDDSKDVGPEKRAA